MSSTALTSKGKYFAPKRRGNAEKREFKHGILRDESPLSRVYSVEQRLSELVPHNGRYVMKKLAANSVTLKLSQIIYWLFE